MGRVAALRLDADLPRLRAEVFVAALAGRALPAADPGINDIALADGDALRIGACRGQFALDLMAEREGKRPAARKLRLAAAAEIEIAVMQMDVGMTYTAMPTRRSTSVPCGAGASTTSSHSGLP